MILISAEEKCRWNTGREGRGLVCLKLQMLHLGGRLLSVEKE